MPRRSVSGSSTLIPAGFKSSAVNMTSQITFQSRPGLRRSSSCSWTVERARGGGGGAVECQLTGGMHRCLPTVRFDGRSVYVPRRCCCRIANTIYYLTVFDSGNCRERDGFWKLSTDPRLIMDRMLLMYFEALFEYYYSVLIAHKGVKFLYTSTTHRLTMGASRGNFGENGGWG